MRPTGKKKVGSVFITVWLVPIIWGVLLGVLLAWRNGVFEPPRPRVLLIGIDGLDWEILDPLIEEGRMPNIGRLVADGTGATLMSREKSLSPIIWTTIATGKKRESHGISGFYDENRRDPEGLRIPLTSADRRVAALWNIMGMQDRTVACLGWWMSWPAEEVNGVQVSAFSSYDRKSTVRRGVHAGEDIERLTWPESLQASIEPYMISVDDVTHEDLDRFLDVEDWDHPMFDLERVDDGVDYVLPWTYATDLSYVQVAEQLFTDETYDLSMVYIQGTDTTCHRFWAFREQSRVLHRILTEYDLMPEEEETYRRYFQNTIDRYYEFADEMVGRLLECVDDNTVVVICSDHGFGPWVDTDVERWSGHTFSGQHRNEGVAIFHGPGIRRGIRLSEQASPYIWDITPTILTLLGLPVAQDMDGTPVMDVLDSKFMRDYNPEFVATYDIDYSAGERPEMVPVSAEYEERLRSLGYIQ